MSDKQKGGITRRTFSAGGLVAGLAAGPVMAQAGSIALPRSPAASDILRGLREKFPIPALSAAVVKNGELIWAEAQGLADLELGVTAEPKHLFRLPSVSKVVTVAIGARLAQAGIIDLDAPIASYREGLPEHHRKTTLRQLYNHQGGVRHYDRAEFDFEALGGIIDGRNYYSTEDGLALFIEDPLIAEPGGQMSYSTFGYSLISAILESATGKSFVDLIAQEVSGPLGLEELSPDMRMAVIKGRVSSYDPAELYRQIMSVPEDLFVLNSLQVNAEYKFAGGGMYGSARDMAKFGAAHLQGGFLNEDIRQMLFSPRTQATDRMPALGLGWRIGHSDLLGKLCHHAGSMQGSRSQIALYPEHGLSVVLLSNFGNTPRNILDYVENIASHFR